MWVDCEKSTCKLRYKYFPCFDYLLETKHANNMKIKMLEVLNKFVKIELQ